ncbi:hypothetical protein NKH77_18260 [Streptomyces sp. M19]
MRRGLGFRLQGQDRGRGPERREEVRVAERVGIGGAGCADVRLSEGCRGRGRRRQDGDATKDAVLRDNGYALRAINLAAAKQDPDLEVLTDYLAGEAAAGWRGGIEELKKSGQTVTGKIRYYDRKAKVTGKTTAGVTFCEDQRYSYNKDVKTGKVHKTTPSDNSFIYHVAFMRKNSDGTWQMAKDDESRGAKSCVR